MTGKPYVTVDVLLTREHHAGQENGLQRGEGPVVAAEDGGQGHAQGLGVSRELVRSTPIDASGHLGKDDDESCDKIMQGGIIIKFFFALTRAQEVSIDNLCLSSTNLSTL